MEEVLTRLLRKNFETYCIGSFYHPIGAPLVSHLLYVDAILIFANGGKRSIRNLVTALETYEKWSGQRISKDKSALFPSKYIISARKRGLLRITGFREGKFPVTYLGAPLVSRKLTSQIMEPFMEKIRKKIAGWRFKLLSQGGRLILLRHVLSSIPIHLMSVVNVPLFDGWLASGPLSVRTEDISNNKMCIKDCWLKNNWNSDLLLELVGANRTMEILHNVTAGKRGQDIFIWKPTPDGEVASEVWHRAIVVLRIPFQRVLPCIKVFVPGLEKLSRGLNLLRVGLNLNLMVAVEEIHEIQEVEVLFGIAMAWRKRPFLVVLAMEDIVAELEGVNFLVLHQYREGNRVADFLAREGKIGKNIIYEDQHRLPRFLKGVLRIVRLGLHSFRQ
ncbi:hypothetical protein QYF36_017173 [Acer negundo]|nr:hypothetical protein QYF36_017173 [Acer negundo]